MYTDNVRNHGFTLIEVLVAVLVLSIGLLGLAAMQAQALKYNQSAYLRTQASALATDMMDRMRANPAEALASAYDIAMNDAPTSATLCTSVGSNCSPADIAAYDLRVWQCQLGNWDSSSACSSSGVLPSGKGSIVRNANLFTVTIQWQDRSDDDGDGSRTTNLSYTTEIRN